jgi:hypothetical protein
MGVRLGAVPVLPPYLVSRSLCLVFYLFVRIFLCGKPWMPNIYNSEADAVYNRCCTKILIAYRNKEAFKVLKTGLTRFQRTQKDR